MAMGSDLQGGVSLPGVNLVLVEADFPQAGSNDHFGSGAAIAGQAVVFDAYPIPALYDRLAKGNASATIVPNLVVPQDVVRIPLANRNPIADIPKNFIALTNRVGRSQTVKNPIGAIPGDPIVLEMVARRARARMEAIAEIVMEVAFSDCDIRAMLKTDALAIVERNIQILQEDPSRPLQKNAPATAPIDGAIIPVALSCEDQIAHGRVTDTKTGNERKYGHDASAFPRMVIVSHWAVRVKDVAIPSDDRRSRHVESVRVVVHDQDPHAHVEQFRIPDLEFIHPKSDHMDEGAVPSWDWLEDCAWLSEDGDIAPQVQGIPQFMDVGRDAYGSSSGLGGGVNGLLK